MVGGVPADIRRDFECIELRGVQFAYPGGQFSVGGRGAIDLRVRRGDVVFVVGGNGSGKSTLLKLLLGLYRPAHGAVLLDGRPITAANRREYRELFAGVFADFCLFERLYGIPDLEQKRPEIARLMQLLQIEQKVAIADGRFSTRDLSTGQRKRLALLASLLEERAVYVFDEWTADQDPDFRRTFYDTILPQELKAAGRTVVAITHDDRFWKKADWRIHLDFGQVSEVVEILHRPNGDTIEIICCDAGRIVRIVRTLVDGIHSETVLSEAGERLEVIRRDGGFDHIQRWRNGECLETVRWD